MSTKLKSKLFVLFFLSLMVSCNKDFEKDIKTYPEGGNKDNQAKILMVVVDGFRGKALADIDPYHIRMMGKNALVAKNSLGDFTRYPFTKETGYANIFTSVTVEKHKVYDNLSTIDLEHNKTFINRIKTTDPAFKASAFTSNAAFKNHLLKDADHVELLSNDAEVISKTKKELLESDANLIISHLTNPYVVGKANSFESSDVKYQEAILNVDKQIGELLDELKKRPGYKDEKWLVIFTSSFGGKIAEDNPLDPTKYDDPLRNTFTYFYSPLFENKNVLKPNTSPYVFQQDVLYQNFWYGFYSSFANFNPKKFDLTKNDDVTFNFFFKADRHLSSNTEQTIFRKRFKGSKISNGWEICYTNVSGASRMRFFGTGMELPIYSDNISLGTWNVYTITVNRKTKLVSMYSNGVLSSTSSIENIDWINSEPLFFGFTGSVYPPYNDAPPSENSQNQAYYCNFQVYKYAYTAQDIKDYAGLGYIDEIQSPYWKDLLGYWPVYSDNNNSNALADASGNGNDLFLLNPNNSSSYTPQFVKNLISSNYIIPGMPASIYANVPNLVDIPVFVYQWFGIIPEKNWNLEGRSWNPPYVILNY